MTLRGARNTDFDSIDQIYKEAGFNLDVKHLQRLVVIEDDGVIVAVGALVTILEAAFVVNNKASKRARVEALKKLMRQAEIEVPLVGYNNYHMFATNDGIEKAMFKHFHCKRTVGDCLIKWIGDNSGKSR